MDLFIKVRTTYFNSIKDLCNNWFLREVCKRHQQKKNNKRFFFILVIKQRSVLYYVQTKCVCKLLISAIIELLRIGFVFFILVFVLVCMMHWFQNVRYYITMHICFVETNILRPHNTYSLISHVYCVHFLLTIQKSIYKMDLAKKETSFALLLLK